jgi:hypothetical protein
MIFRKQFNINKNGKYKIPLAGHIVKVVLPKGIFPEALIEVYDNHNDLIFSNNNSKPSGIPGTSFEPNN